MSKLIAVWGCSGVGKTTLASKLAYTLANNMRKNTILLSAGIVVPTLPLLFPTNKAIEGKSIGKAVQKADITQQDILMNSVAISKSLPLIVSGYNLFENSYTYASFNIDKWKELLLQMSQMADYVIVDCSSDFSNNKPTSAAMALADSVIQIYAAEYRSEIFFASQQKVLKDENYDDERFIKAIMIGHNSRNQASNEIINAKNIKNKIPFSEQVGHQYQSGTLFSGTSDRAFNDAVLKLLKEVM